MRLGMYLTSLTKPELEELRERLNLTDDELLIFDLLSRGKVIHVFVINVYYLLLP